MKRRSKYGNLSEAAIQRAIHNYLQVKERMGDLYYKRENSFSGQIQRRNGSKGWIQNGKPGHPDFVICYKGAYIGLEIKSAIGKQSDEQRETQAKIEKVGGRYYVIRSLEDVIKIIK